MATAAPVYEERRVSIGRIFQRAFSAVALNPVVVLGLALVVGALPGLIMTYVFVQMGLGSPAALQSGAVSPSAFAGAAFISSIVGLIISALVQAALTRATVSAIEGRRVSFGESLSTALRVVLPLIGFTILFTLGVALGFVLLIVPGIILILMWGVAVPALVIEREGVFPAFSRSAELTKGARWKILGLFLVLLVIYWLLSVVVGLVGLGMYGPSSIGGLSVANLLGSVIVGTIFNALWGTIQPALYVELRHWKEGDSVQALADVFA
jgi:hypothetical protein